jgi:hypothetical protein
LTYASNHIKHVSLLTRSKSHSYQRLLSLKNRLNHSKDTKEESNSVQPKQRKAEQPGLDEPTVGKTRSEPGKRRAEPDWEAHGKMDSRSGEQPEIQNQHHEIRIEERTHTSSGGGPDPAKIKTEDGRKTLSAHDPSTQEQRPSPKPDSPQKSGRTKSTSKRNRGGERKIR